MGRPASCHCGTCTKCRHREYMRTWYAGHPGYAAEQARKHRDRAREYEKAKYANDLDFRARKIARNKLIAAVLRGEIVRGCCEVCGAPEAQAHHHDYDLPFDVVWLCDLHHRATHGEHTAVEKSAQVAF